MTVVQANLYDVIINMALVHGYTVTPWVDTYSNGHDLTHPNKATIKIFQKEIMNVDNPNFSYTTENYKVAILNWNGQHAEVVNYQTLIEAVISQ